MGCVGGIIGSLFARTDTRGKGTLPYLCMGIYGCFHLLSRVVPFSLAERGRNKLRGRLAIFWDFGSPISTRAAACMPQTRHRILVMTYIHSNKKHTPHQQQIELMQSSRVKEVQDLIRFDDRHDRMDMTKVCLKQAMACFTAR